MSQTPKQWTYIVENLRGEALYAFPNPLLAADYMQRSINTAMLRMVIVEVRSYGY